MPAVYVGSKEVVARYVGSKPVIFAKIGEDSFSGVSPSVGRTMLAKLTSSLILDQGAGSPTFTRATKAWGLNELGYLTEIASGCAFFGGARLVRNLAVRSEAINAGWTLGGLTAFDANTLLESAGGTIHQIGTSITTLGTYLLEVWLKRGTGSTRHVRLEVSSSDLARVNFNLDTGAVASILQSGTLSLINYGADASVDAGGYRRFYIRVNASASASSTFYPARLTESLNGPISYSGDGTSSILISKVKISDVTNYDASYVPEYVSVGVLSAPFHGAGIDGAKYFETDWQGAPIPSANLLGFRRETAATNNLLYCRDLSNAAWSTKTNITAAKAATGIDGIANTATTLTATATDAIILQPITLASAERCASAYVKRRTGTGTISFTQDGGSSWTDITSQINSSSYSRVQITSTLANPSVGFKISTSGDAIDVDVVQNEAGSAATSPIVTTTATVTRNAEVLTYPTIGNIDFAAGTLYAEAQFANAAVVRRIAVVGSDGYSYANSVDPYTVWKAYDGTNIVQQTGLSDITTAVRKRVVAWGSGTMKVTGDGLAPASGSFDGSFGGASTIDIGQGSIGYIRNIAIYNYKMTDAELQGITA